MENPEKSEIEASMNQTLSMDHCMILFAKPKRVIFVHNRSGFNQLQVILVGVSTAILTALIILTVVLLRRRLIKKKIAMANINNTIRLDMLMVEANDI